MKKWAKNLGQIKQGKFATTVTNPLEQYAFSFENKETKVFVCFPTQKKPL